MTELFRLVEQPRTCSYLPAQTASLEVRAVKEVSPAEYGEMLSRGWRRFGWQFFRPACPHCRECRSIRVLAQQFQASTGQRRVMRKNEGVRAQLHPLFVVRETVDLYNRYQRFMHEHRGWQLQQASAASYHDMFLSGPSELGRQWLYFDGDRLIGVAMMDEVPGHAVSLVYFFHDPEWRAQSPGVFSMNYKNRFRPYEMLDEYVKEGDSPLWRKI